MLSNQCKLVLDHITSRGYITPLVAMNYGVTRLASRIHDLKKAGYPVVKQTERDLFGKRYSRYTIAL
jgi:hypothetical protein